MMGHEKRYQGQLFYTRFILERRVRKDHMLRQIARHIDFDFIYNEVKDTYGQRGNVSVPPPVILKMMLLLILYNVRSERELMETIPERLDWLWFLGYDLDDEIPNHSVLSKARARWGVKAFQNFFERIVWQCVETGLVDGRKLFMDGSLIDANASNNSVVKQQDMRPYLIKSYLTLESRLEEHQDATSDEDDNIPKSGHANRKYVSTTDPDASVVRMGKGKSKLRYQVHRAVDERAEIITATEVTPGEVSEAHRMTALVNQHQENTGKNVKTVVADSKYGTIDNYLSCHELGIASHFESFDKSHRNSGRRKGIFPASEFIYNADEDLFICPAGERLRRRSYYKQRNHYEYSAGSKVCAGCRLRNQCTRAKSGRSIKRHARHDDLDRMLACSENRPAKRDIKKRQHLMERSFAHSTRYGFKRARWRRLWRVQIQEYLTAAIQNIKVLIRSFKDQSRAVAMTAVKTPCGRSLLTLHPRRSDSRYCKITLSCQQLTLQPMATVVR